MTSLAEIYQKWRFGEQRHRWHDPLDFLVDDGREQLTWSTGYPAVGYPPIPVVSDGVKWGIDISGMYDGKPDMQALKARGASFVIVKACDGTLKSRYFDENAAAAIQAGLYVGAYCWLYRNIRISGRAQATAWWNIVKFFQLSFVAIDFEWTFWNGVQDGPDTGDLYGAAIPFEELSGFKPAIYSAPGYLAGKFNYAAMWKNYSFWIAQYNVLKPNSVQPWGANGHILWQLTDRWPGAELGVDPAASKQEDGDLFNGTDADLARVFGGVNIPTPPTPPPPEPPPPAPIPNPGIITLADGITYEKTDYIGTVYHLVKFDMGKVNFIFDNYKNSHLPLISVGDWPANALIAINAGGFMEYNTYGIPWGICASKGHKYCSNKTEQSIYISKTNAVTWAKPSPIYNAVNYSNKFITNGKLNGLLDDTIKDARTMIGTKGNTMFWFSTEPMTKLDACAIGILYNLEHLANMDGGQSTTMRIKGLGIVNGINARKVLTHIGVTPK